MLEVFGLVLVSILWGITNPFLKQGGSGIGKVYHSNKLIELALKLKYIIFNWRCLVPLLINQCGSLLYFISLSFTNISLAVPITNSLTLLFTTVTSTLLGEKLHLRQVFGSALVICGVCLCVVS